MNSFFISLLSQKIFWPDPKKNFKTLITFKNIHQTMSYKYGVDASDADLQDEYGFYGGQSYNFSQKSTF